MALTLQSVALNAQAAPGATDGGVVGTVRSWRRGQTLAGALVSLETVNDSGTPRRISAASDSAGHYVVRAAAGVYVLSARTINEEASGTARATVRVHGNDTVRIDLFIPPYGFDPARRQAQLDELAKNHDLWQRRGHAVYRATVERECFCFGGGVGEWRIEVRPESTVVLRSPLHGGDRPPITSVEALFDWLETEIRDPGRVVKVSYDARLGYPTDIDTDIVAFLTDMWMRVHVRNVVALTTYPSRIR